MSVEVQTNARRAAPGCFGGGEERRKKKQAAQALGIIHSIQLVPLATITITLASARGPKSGASLRRLHLRCAAGCWMPKYPKKSSRKNPPSSGGANSRGCSAGIKFCQHRRRFCNASELAEKLKWRLRGVGGGGGLFLPF